MSETFNAHSPERIAEMKKLEEELNKRAAEGKKIEATGDKDAYDAWWEDDMIKRVTESRRQKAICKEAFMQWWFIQRPTLNYTWEWHSKVKDWQSPDNVDRAELNDHEFPGNPGF
jgi:radical SAM superfamily enzyme YgiQ (UPF0313 family)